MKKLTKLFSLALVALMSAVMVSCDDHEPEPQPEPTPEVTTPTISVTAGEAGEDWLSFSVTSANVKRAFFVAITEEVIGDVTVDADFVLDSPNLVPKPNTTCEIRFEGRTPDTKYYIYAAGINDNGDKVLSECVEMTTLAHEYSTVALPTPDNCNVDLTVLTTVDRYAFTITNNANTLNFSFNIYAQKGSNGAIPAGQYTVSDFIAAGAIDLSSINLEVEGLPKVISDGALNLELLEEGKKIRLNGTFKLVSGDSATLDYEGAVAISGTDSGESAAVVFTVVNNLTAAEGMEGVEGGWHEVQFLLGEDSSTMLNLQFNSDPSKTYITGGFYPVFDSKASAEAMGMGNSWITTASFYQENITPYTILPGMDSYVQITTDMDSGEGDYYEITFSLKISSLVDQSEAVLNATYKGALGFEATEEEDNNTLEMVQYYVSITSEGNTHTLDFFGPVQTLGMTVVIEGELPQVGSDYIWYDIISGNFFDYIMAQEDASLSNAPLLEGSRIAIRRFNDAADASDEGIVKPYYGFKLEAQVEGYDLIGDWTSFGQNKATE